MEISVELIKELRNLTGVGVNDCRSALKETKGNIEKAIEVLRKKGLETAKKKQDLVAKQGRVESYIHMGAKLGAMVEINCQTDFVAKTDEFINFAKEVVMQIVAMNPQYIKQEDVPKDLLGKETDAERFYQTHCLLEQPFIKDQSLKIRDRLHALIAKTGENIVIRRFARFQLGQE
ncbi:MAG: translation elongation factor Ts [Candidatus Omnitrophota bacterium]